MTGARLYASHVACGLSQLGALHVSLLCACLSLVVPVHAYAQDTTASYTTLAAPLRIVDDVVRSGDIVSYESAQGLYTLSRVSEDVGMFGVVVEDPVLYMDNATQATGTVPVVRFGEALVNVSTLNGEVRAGDLITSSPIIGVGQRVDPDSARYILGFALEDAVFGSRVVEVDGEDVRLGDVSVALRIGSYTYGDSEDGLGVKGEAADKETVDNLITKVGELEMASQIFGAGAQRATWFQWFRYILGAGVAIASTVLALRRFGELFSQSIISVGRNPLARRQIRGILVWNAVLILLVSSVGFGVGIAVIVL